MVKKVPVVLTIGDHVLLRVRNDDTHRASGRKNTVTFCNKKLGNLKIKVLQKMLAVNMDHTLVAKRQPIHHIQVERLSLGRRIEVDPILLDNTAASNVQL